jgi:hypothetical protein
MTTSSLANVTRDDGLCLLSRPRSAQSPLRHRQLHQHENCDLSKPNPAGSHLSLLGRYPVTARFPGTVAGGALALSVALALPAVLHFFLLQRRKPVQLLRPSTSLLPHVFVTVYSYDRPADLHRLLSDIADRAASAAAANGIRVAVHVLDDNSLGCLPPPGPSSSNFFDAFRPDDPLPLTQLIPQLGGRDAVVACSARRRFRFVESLIQLHEESGWKLFVSHYRHGRRRYWHLIHMSHSLLRPYTAGMKSEGSLGSTPYLIFLPDDVRLASGFFELTIALWGAVLDKRKLTLMLHIESSREHVAVWTDLRPERVSQDLVRIGWVESGNFMAGPDFVRFFNWSFPRVPIERWVDNPPISSGVGAYMSEAIHEAGYRMYRTSSSLVAHVGVTLSKMNGEFRDMHKPAHRTLYFADGEDAYEEVLLQAPTVTASIASVWHREVALYAAIDSLAPQVDHINVYLNGYDVVPTFLDVPYVTALLSSKSPRGDIGDVGKFFWANELKTAFHLTADDDIVYPRNFVDVMAGHLGRYFDSGAVVGLHGIVIEHDKLIPSNGRQSMGYYRSRKVFMGVGEDVEEFQNVHILGTGTVVYRVSDFEPFDIARVFRSANMADVWFGILAQQLGLSMMVVPHAKDWIMSLEGTYNYSIYSQATRKRSRSGDSAQTRAAISAAPWKLHPPLRRQ